MSVPVLTVITPSYNQGRYLTETIESVLTQDVPGLEYIVVDGGSTDESVPILERYSSKLAWWVSQKDRGQAHAINKGLARATGRFVAYLSSDDTYLPGAMHAALGMLERTPGARWVAAGVIGFDESFRYLFDNNLHASLLARGEGCIALDRPLASYRFHPSSKTVAEGGLFEAEWDRIREHFVPLLPRHLRLVARHRIALLKSGAAYARAAQREAEGDRAEARALFASAFRAYPPSLLTRSGLGCVRRLLAGGM